MDLRLWEVAALAPRGLALRQVALPYLEDLSEATHENVQLAARDGGEVVCIEWLAPARLHAFARFATFTS